MKKKAFCLHDTSVPLWVFNWMNEQNWFKRLMANPTLDSRASVAQIAIAADEMGITEIYCVNDKLFVRIPEDEVTLMILKAGND